MSKVSRAAARCHPPSPPPSPRGRTANSDILVPAGCSLQDVCVLTVHNNEDEHKFAPGKGYEEQFAPRKILGS